MGEGLGYRRYVAHGSDLGAGVTARLARAHPGAVAGIHLATPGLAPPPKPWSPVEQAHFAEVDAWTGEEGGYAHVHSTKPATLGAALHDSPAGAGRLDRGEDHCLEQQRPASRRTGAGAHAITIFGGERVPFPKPPRELAERYFHVTSWAEHDCGGHFPAVARTAGARAAPGAWCR